ncbi:hypothetical protein ADK66_24575 [Micromonospora sp. NRRL B-16802]|nr:hypothetical protein ADK66_24575 [Micromonospora sp. NRRL B-16802]
MPPRRPGREAPDGDRRSGFGAGTAPAASAGPTRRAYPAPGRARRRAAGLGRRRPAHPAHLPANRCRRPVPRALRRGQRGTTLVERAGRHGPRPGRYG